MLLNGQTEVSQQDMKTYNFTTAKPEFLESLPSPRVMATHRYFWDLPTDMLMKKIKLVSCLN